MEKLWHIAKPNPQLQKELSEALGIPILLAQLLINREVTTVDEARQFIQCSLEDLHDPFLMKDMDKAVARIKLAIEKGEKITVWGDYDVDGITSVGLLKNVLEQLGAYVTYYIPHRIEEGFGLNLTGVSAVSRNKTNLLITVDCGVNNVSEVSYLNEVGIDTIITDHHQPKNSELPKAHAIINPLQEGCQYPFKYLAGVGLAFKLACALCEKIKGISNQMPLGHLDLVALGIISDISPMSGENRILTRYGLQRLTETEKEGLIALKKITRIDKKTLSTMHAGYILGPRLNAAGRMGSAEESLKLILSTSPEDASQLAERLDKENKNRQKLERKTFNEALVAVDREVNFKSHRIIILHQDDWHPGVVGIVASKIAERFYRPAILLSFKEQIGKGSGRSVENFHLFKALDQCSGFLERFGGHRKACGLSIRRENLEGFKEAINKQAEVTLAQEDLRPRLEIDSEILLSQLNEKVIRQVEDLAPFGLGNRRPLFCTRKVVIKSQPRILGKETIKMWVCNDNFSYEAIGFRMASQLQSLKMGQEFDIAYTPSINQWQGEDSIQLELKDAKL